MKQNKNGKPRKTFALAISIAEKQKEQAWDKIMCWQESEETWRAEKNNPEHADHYEFVVKRLEDAWTDWQAVARVLRELEEIENA